MIKKKDMVFTKIKMEINIRENIKMVNLKEKGKYFIKINLFLMEILKMLKRKVLKHINLIMEKYLL